MGKNNNGGKEKKKKRVVLSTKHLMFGTFAKKHHTVFVQQRQSRLRLFRNYLFSSPFEGSILTLRVVTTMFPFFFFFFFKI